MPTYLKSRLGIDFRDGHRELGFEEIIRAIYNKPANVKPPLGKPPVWLDEGNAGRGADDITVKGTKESVKKTVLESVGNKRFTSSDIAAFTGKTQASVHRVLSDMLDEGLIIRAGEGYLVRKADEVTPTKIKVCIRAWQEVINPATGKTHDEVGLKALDAIMYGPVHEVVEITSNLEKELLDEFKALYPDFRFDRYEIRTDEEKE